MHFLAPFSHLKAYTKTKSCAWPFRDVGLHWTMWVPIHLPGFPVLLGFLVPPVTQSCVLDRFPFTFGSEMKPGPLLKQLSLICSVIRAIIWPVFPGTTWWKLPKEPCVTTPTLLNGAREAGRWKPAGSKPCVRVTPALACCSSPEHQSHRSSVSPRLLPRLRQSYRPEWEGCKTFFYKKNFNFAKGSLMLFCFCSLPVFPSALFVLLFMCFQEVFVFFMQMQLSKTR